MGIRAFVFDCGGVVLRNGDLSAYTLWGERLGLAPDELRRRLWTGEPWVSAERGQISDAEFWRRIGAVFGLGAPEQVATLREDLWGTWVVDEQVLALVDRLRSKYRVALLSNASDALEDILRERFGIADRFDPLLSSARLGLAKPDRAIYEELLKRLQLEPHEVVYIDDAAENIAAAAGLGLHVVWFVNAAELERQLEPYLR